MARRFNARPSSPWSGDLPVFERRLANGLKALVLPRRHAPVVVCDLYYPVGSADEPAGLSGLAHFLEHMLFKGTSRFPKGEIDRLAFRSAGASNAETSEDGTHFWFSFPSDRWEIALELEADRMTGALFDPKEVEAERLVIAEERARELESPFGRLDQAHLSVSYLRHPYRNPILGWPEEFGRISVDDLKSFYRARYRPAGAVLVIVGDVDPARTFDRVEATFTMPGDSGKPRVSPTIQEPPQIGRRDFSLFEPESIPRGLLGWHSVPLGHPDGPALHVAADLLTCGRRSRLWDRLVEEDKIATWVDSAQESARLAGQFLIQIEAAPGSEPKRVEDAIRDVIEKLAEEGPTTEELSRCRNRLEAAWRWEQEDSAGLAAGLGNVALWGDWRRWQDEHRAALAVESDDIRRVVSAILADTNLTAGWSLPRSGRSVVSLKKSASKSVARASRIEERETPEPRIVASPKGIDFRPGRRVLDNGLRVIWENRPGTGVVAIELSVDAGMLRESKPGVAHLTGRLLEEGTTSRSAKEMSEVIEDAGGSLEVGATGASLRVRSEDLATAVDWLADLVMRPSLPEDMLPWLKRKLAAEYRSDRDDPAFRAEQLFRSLVYGEHPYARDPRGGSREIQRLSRQDVLDHHERFFTPDNTFLAACGDFDPRTLVGLVKSRFGAWSKRRGDSFPTPPLSRAPRGTTRRVAYRGEQVHIYIGHLGVPRSHPDFDALCILDQILSGGTGFTDRLGRILREEMGLVYTVSGGMTDSADVEPGVFRVYLGADPHQAERASRVVLDQLRSLQAGEIDDREVENARDFLRDTGVFDFQTVEQRASRLYEIERWNLPLDDPIRRPLRLSRITPEEVRRVAREQIDPKALFRVELGPSGRGRTRGRG